MTRQTKATLASILLHGTILAVVLVMPRSQPERQPVLNLDFQTAASGSVLAPPCKPAVRQESVKPAKDLRSEKAKKEPERIVPVAQIPPQPVAQESRPSEVDPAGQASPSAGGPNAAPGKGVAVASSSSGDPAPLREIAFGETFGPAFIKRVPPEYPRQEKRLGHQGKVVLRLYISELGELLSVEIVEACSTLFGEATLEAIRASSFRPAIVNGKAVACKAILPVRFELKN